MLSWQDGLPLEIVGWSGGNLARPVSMQTMSTVSHDFEARHLPIGATDVAKTAMAFYREGVSIGNPFYAYLSLYKAFSVAVPNGKGREAWINAALPTLTSRTAVERLNVLVQGGVDIAKHLYDGNRHSIAHANKEPFVNPDRDDDRRRIALDIPLMRELAESAIEQNLGVDRLVTAYVKHSYELTGLAKRVVPREFVEQMQAGKAAGECTIDAPDELALVARCGEVIEIVSPVREAQWELDATGITLVALSPDRAARFLVRFDFAAGRLLFDPMGDALCFLSEFRTKAQALDAAKVMRLRECLYRNGRFEVWDAAGEVKLGESQPYLPFNCRIDFSAIAAAIAAVEALAATLE